MDYEQIIERLESANNRKGGLVFSERYAIEKAIKEIRKLKAIEKITRAAFADPSTNNIDLHRAQALANILAVFEYDGATIKEESKL